MGWPIEYVSMEFVMESQVKLYALMWYLIYTDEITHFLSGNALD